MFSDNFFCHLRRNIFVMVELHFEGSLTLGNCAEVNGIFRNLCIGYLSRNYAQAVLYALHAQNASAFGVQIADNIAHQRIGTGYI